MFSPSAPANRRSTSSPARGRISDATRKIAVLVIGAQEALEETLIRDSAAAGMSGIVMMFGRGDGPRPKGPILDIADRFGLFIAGAAADPKDAAL